MAENVRIEVIGDPLKVEVAFRTRDAIQLQHMEAAMVDSMEHLKDVWQMLAPVGQGRESNSSYPSWNTRAPGTYKRSIHVTPVVPFGDSFLGAVESDDKPVAKILESGSGIYATGRASRPFIRSGSGKKLAVPGGQLSIGPSVKRFPTRSNGLAKADLEDARFLKSVKGQRPQRISRKARIESAPYTKAKFKLAAHAATLEIKAML